MNNINPLLGRVDPYNGESLPSILMRAGAKNCIPYRREIFTLIGTRGTPFCKRPTPNSNEINTNISALLELANTAVEEILHPVVTRKGLSDSVRFNGTLIPRRFLELNVRRYSPASLRKKPFGRTMWMLRPLSFCPESMELLEDTCRHCGHDLGWLNSKGIHVCDKCGRSLRNVQPGKIPWNLRNDAKIVAGLVSSDASARTENLLTFPEPFRHWEPGDVFSAIVDLGRLAEEMSGKKQEEISPDQLPVSYLIEGYRIVAGWPATLADLVGSLAEGRSGSWITMIGPMGKFLRSKRNETPLSLLLHEKVSELFQVGVVPVTSYRGPRSKWINNERYITGK